MSQPSKSYHCPGPCFYKNLISKRNKHSAQPPRFWINLYFLRFQEFILRFNGPSQTGIYESTNTKEMKGWFFTTCISWISGFSGNMFATYYFPLTCTMSTGQFFQHGLECLPGRSCQILLDFFFSRLWFIAENISLEIVLQIWGLL